MAEQLQLECWTTGYRCVRPDGHAGRHQASDGRRWGGERCGVAGDGFEHVFHRRHTTHCECGDVARPEPTRSRAGG